MRSDSDMFTLGYSFRPWNRPESIADGSEIRQYIKDTAAEFGVDRKIRRGHRPANYTARSVAALSRPVRSRTTRTRLQYSA